MLERKLGAFFQVGTLPSFLMEAEQIKKVLASDKTNSGELSAEVWL